MSLFMMLLEAAPDTEERVNITPVLLRFGLKFLLIFAAVAVITILTPYLAKWVDRLREKYAKQAPPEDPRCKAVKGPYDMPEPAAKKKKRKKKRPVSHSANEPRKHNPKKRPPAQSEYQPKHSAEESKGKP